MSKVNGSGEAAKTNRADEVKDVSTDHEDCHKIYLYSYAVCPGHGGTLHAHAFIHMLHDSC